MVGLSVWPEGVQFVRGRRGRIACTSPLHVTAVWSRSLWLRSLRERWPARSVQVGRLLFRSPERVVLVLYDTSCHLRQAGRMSPSRARHEENQHHPRSSSTNETPFLMCDFFFEGMRFDFKTFSTTARLGCEISR